MHSGRLGGSRRDVGERREGAGWNETVDPQRNVNLHDAAVRLYRGEDRSPRAVRKPFVDDGSAYNPRSEAMGRVGVTVGQVTREHAAGHQVRRDLEGLARRVSHSDGSVRVAPVGRAPEPRATVSAVERDAERKAHAQLVRSRRVRVVDTVEEGVVVGGKDLYRAAEPRSLAPGASEPRRYVDDRARVGVDGEDGPFVLIGPPARSPE